MVQGLPNTQITTCAVLYAIGAHGIMTLNDFKALKGDTALGIRSLPAQLGPNKAARIACWVMTIQVIVATFAAALGFNAKCCIDWFAYLWANYGNA